MFRFTLYDRWPVIVNVKGTVARQWSLDFHGPSISPTGYRSELAGVTTSSTGEPTKKDLHGLEIWAKAKAIDLHNTFALERARQIKQWPIKYAKDVELQVNEMFYRAYPISWAKFNQEWHFWLWDMDSVRVINLNRQTAESIKDQSYFLPAHNLVGPWQEDGYWADYGRKTQRVVQKLDEPKPASKGKPKVAAPAPVIVQPIAQPIGRTGLRVVNRLGAVTIWRGDQRLGLLSWLQGRDLFGDSALIAIALDAKIDLYKSNESFTLSYNDNHGWLISKP